jgi:DNA adenine methylase
MRYMAGKSRFAKELAKAILRHTSRRVEYFEPFVGGGSVLEEMSKCFAYSYASDTHRDLILMWQALMDGWEPPRNVSYEEFKFLERQPSSALRGFVGFSCSFAGKWFGPYARFVKPGGKLQNFADESARNLEHCISVLRNCKFHCRSYDTIPYTPLSVIYADPPYRDTYSYSPFDSDKFWDWAREAVKAGAHVYVSEFVAPEDWVSIWSIERIKRFRALVPTQKRERFTEHLFVHESQRERQPLDKPKVCY